MTTRITQIMLDHLCYRLNLCTNSPLMPYSRDATGRFIANARHYLLDYAYGGVQLQRILDTSGTVTTPLGDGYITKRKLYYQMQAYLLGIQDRTKDTGE